MSEYMQAALAEAKKGVQAGEGGPFGAVVVKEGKIIARAHNEVVLRNDPTAHAEILAIREASAKLGSFELKECTLYCVGEPCPMCFSAILWARMKEVYFCNTKEEAAAVGFDDTAIMEILLQKRKSPVPFIHQEAPSCKEVLYLWERKEDKVPY